VRLKPSPPPRRHPPQNGADRTRAGSSSSLVQPSETKSPVTTPVIDHPRFGSTEFDCQPASDAEQRFRHSGWAVRRQHVYAALCRSSRPNARIERFVHCGAGLALQVSKDGTDMRWVCDRCKDRLCTACCSERSAAFAERLAQHIAGKTTRFITLTLRHSNTPLSAQLDRLYRSFASLRRRKDLKCVFEGGAAFLEVKLSRDNALWHPHLHIVTEGTFVEQKALSRAWHEVTGDSSIVDIRRVADIGDVSRYVCKYVTKPADASIFNVADRLDEFICSIGGRRLCLTFGTWRGFKLDADPQDVATWITVGSISSLRQDAAEGNADAIRYLDAAARKWPLFASIFATPPPDVEVP
jgi:Replication protein